MPGHVVYENIGNDWGTDDSRETEPGTAIGNNNNNNNNNNNYYYYLPQLGCHPVAVVILHINKYEIGYHLI